MMRLARCSTQPMREHCWPSPLPQPLSEPVRLFSGCEPEELPCIPSLSSIVRKLQPEARGAVVARVLRPARAEQVASYTASTTPLWRLDSCWHDPNQAWWFGFTVI